MYIYVFGTYDYEGDCDQYFFHKEKYTAEDLLNFFAEATKMYVKEKMYPLLEAVKRHFPTQEAFREAMQKSKHPPISKKEMKDYLNNHIYKDYKDYKRMYKPGEDLRFSLFGENQIFLQDEEETTVIEDPYFFNHPESFWSHYRRLY